MEKKSGKKPETPANGRRNFLKGASGRRYRRCADGWGRAFTATKSASALGRLGATGQQ